VKLDSFFRRLAVALNYLDYNLVGSSAINDDSRLLMVRSVQARVRKLAPFLSFDGDPYPVSLGGRVLWVVDGYTTSNRYPYSETADVSHVTDASGLKRTFNYVRNSVKAVVDGYDGTVNMYIVDPTDPIINVWQSAFPGLFQPMSAMPAGLADHLRYPEDIFRVQTAAYSKYQLTAADFFDRGSGERFRSAARCSLRSVSASRLPAAEFAAFLVPDQRPALFFKGARDPVRAAPTGSCPSASLSPPAGCAASAADRLIPPSASAAFPALIVANTSSGKKTD